MKKILLLCLFPVLATLSACDKCQSNDEAGVAAAIEKLRLAMISGKAADLGAVAGDNLIYIHSAGLVENKAEYVDNIASKRSVFVTIDLSDQSIKMNGDVAIARHTLFAKTNNGGVPGTVRIGIMTVWQKQKGEWKLIGRQAQKL